MFTNKELILITRRGIPIVKILPVALEVIQYSGFFRKHGKRAPYIVFQKKEITRLCLVPGLGKLAEKRGGFCHPESDFGKQHKRIYVFVSIFKYIESIAASSAPALVIGESGVGKELIARAIHFASGRKGKFIALNIAGIDKTMFIDTLFGHEKGAFTGAEQRRKGLIEEAKEGTLFLDEIGDLDMEGQVKLLRFFDERMYRPLGSDIEKSASIKIIAATNADLEKKQEEGKIRKDFYFRFAQHVIRIPPLRERPDDLPLLVEYFIKQAASEMQKAAPTYPKTLFLLLENYTFPGNVRELKGIIFDAVTTADAGKLALSYFRDYIASHSSRTEVDIMNNQGIERKIIYSGRFPTLKELEDFFIDEALKKTGSIKSNAARLLGISKYTLHRLLQKREK